MMTNGRKWGLLYIYEQRYHFLVECLTMSILILTLRHKLQASADHVTPTGFKIDSKNKICSTDHDEQSSARPSQTGAGKPSELHH